MTVKDALALLNSPSEVDLSFNGDIIRFNFRNQIEVDAWADYLVSSIYAEKECVFELVLAAKPVKKGADA